jgi:hypothetical protein
MACFIVFLNDSNISENYSNGNTINKNKGGFLMRPQRQQSRSTSSSSSNTLKRIESPKEKMIREVKPLFKQHIDMAIARIFQEKPNDFLIKNVDLNLSGVISIDDKTYILRFIDTTTTISKYDLLNINNWSIQEYDGKEQIGELKDIQIDITNLDVKKTEKFNNFKQLLPNIIDDMFKIVGKSSTLNNSSELREKTEGKILYDDNQYYFVRFRDFSDKVKIENFKNINNWTITYYVKNTDQLRNFEDNRKLDLTKYRTYVSFLKNAFM